MAEYLFILGVGLAAGLLAWFAAGGGQVLYQRYRSSFQAHTRERMQEFYLFVDPAQLWGVNLAVACVVAAALWLLSGAFWVAVVSVGPLLVMPYAVLRFLRQRRLDTIETQLPEFLLALAGAIQAGSGLQQAMRHIAQQTPQPLGQELGLLLRESRMGLAFDQTLVNLAARVPAESMNLWVSSLRVASHTGGNLAPLLEDIAATLRARNALKGKIHALTSQGRLQAWIMACLPWLLAAVLTFMDPQAMAILWHTPVGWAAVVAIMVLDAVGLWFIRRIVDIKV